MQDLKFLNFDGSNLNDLALMNQYQYEKYELGNPNPEKAILCVDHTKTLSLFIEEHNIVIQQSFKVAKSTMQAINDKILRKIGLTTTIFDNNHDLYQVLENRKPLVWRLFRDPLQRALSSFNFIKQIQQRKYGIEWDICKFDPYLGNDVHFLPQTGTLPCYIDDKIFQSSLERCIAVENNFFDNKMWCYDNLEDLKPYENIEYFWLNERSILKHHNVFDFILDKLDIKTTTDDVLTIGDRNMDLNRIHCENFSNERIRSFDQEAIERIYTAYEPERQFFKSLTWQNMEPVFYE